MVQLNFQIWLVGQSHSHWIVDAFNSLVRARLITCTLFTQTVDNVMRLEIDLPTLNRAINY